MLNETNANGISRSGTASHHWRPVMWWCGAVVIAGVMTGTLLPFSLDVAPGGVDELFGLTRLSWHAADGGSMSDALANIFVYVPVGVALALWLARPGRSAVTRLGATLGIGVVMSVGLEWMQTMMSMRVASWTDVRMNGIGTFIGAAVVHGRGLWMPARDRLTRAFAWRPMATSVKLMTVGLVVYHLLPFDVVTSTDAMWESLRQARVQPTMAQVDVATQMAWLGYAGQCAFLGFLCVLALRERGRSVWDAVNGALTHVAIVTLLIEVLQLFVASHTFDCMDWLVGASGGMIGVSLAAALVAKAQVPSLRQALGLVLLLQVLYLLASSAAPFDWTWPARDGSQVIGLPFWGQFLRPFGVAMASLLETAVTFTVLAAVTRWLLLQKPRALRMIGVVVIVVAVASACEMLQMLTASRYPDVTNPLIALCVAVAVAMLEPAATQRMSALARMRTGHGA